MKCKKARKMMQGGKVRGPGTATSDSILARVSNGEYVLPKPAVDLVGVQNLNALRQAALAQSLPGYALGGEVNEYGNDLTLTNRMNAGAESMRRMREGPMTQPTQQPVTGLSSLFGPTPQQQQQQAYSTARSGADALDVASGRFDREYQPPRFAAGGSVGMSQNQWEGLPRFAYGDPVGMPLDQLETSPRFSGNASAARDYVKWWKQAIPTPEKPPIEFKPPTQPRPVANPATGLSLAPDVPLEIPVASRSAVTPTLNIRPSQTPNQVRTWKADVENMAQRLNVSPQEAAKLMSNQKLSLAPGEIPAVTARPTVPAKPIVNRPPSGGYGSAVGLETPKITPAPTPALAPGMASNVKGLAVGPGMVTGGEGAFALASMGWDTLANLGKLGVKDSAKLAYDQLMYDELSALGKAPPGGRPTVESRLSEKAIPALSERSAPPKNPLDFLEGIETPGPSMLGTTPPPGARQSRVFNATAQQPDLMASGLANPGVPYNQVQPLPAAPPLPTTPGPGAGGLTAINATARGQELPPMYTTGSRQVGMMPATNTAYAPTGPVQGSALRPQYETNYRDARGNTMAITGPNQRVGGGTLSVLDQGNGGTVEGNVAALNRQLAALQSRNQAYGWGGGNGGGMPAGPDAQTLAALANPFYQAGQGFGDEVLNRDRFMRQFERKPGEFRKSWAQRQQTGLAQLNGLQEQGQQRMQGALGLAGLGQRQQQAGYEAQLAQQKALQDAQQWAATHGLERRKVGLSEANAGYEAQRNAGNDALNAAKTLADIQRGNRPTADAVLGQARANYMQALVAGDQPAIQQWKSVLDQFGQPTPYFAQ